MHIGRKAEQARLLLEDLIQPEPTLAKPFAVATPGHDQCLQSGALRPDRLYLPRVRLVGDDCRNAGGPDPELVVLRRQLRGARHGHEAAPDEPDHRVPPLGLTPDGQCDPVALRVTARLQRSRELPAAPRYLVERHPLLLLAALIRPQQRELRLLLGPPVDHAAREVVSLRERGRLQFGHGLKTPPVVASDVGARGVPHSQLRVTRWQERAKGHRPNPAGAPWGKRA